MTKIGQKVLTHVKAACKTSGVTLYVGKGKHVKCDEFKVNGYFDCKKKVLAFSTGTPAWVLVASHEVSHMQQWVDQCIAWKEYCSVTNDVSDFFEWSDESFRVTIAMERDCEQRSVKLLRSFGYPKKRIDEYIQKANAYTLFYHYVHEYKKWYKIGVEPYNLPKVWKKFPKVFGIDQKAVYNDLKQYYAYCV